MTQIVEKSVDTSATYVRPPMPTFATVEEERLHRKQHLAAALRLFARYGLSEGTAGHMTVRDPERTDHFWVNPYRMDFAKIRVSDLILVDRDGTVVEGKYAVNPAAFVIHSCVHDARPDAIGVVHTHSPYGQVWSALGRLLDPITQVSCAFYNDHGLLDEYTGLVFDFDTGERLAKALGTTKGVILQNHGLLTVGETIDEAAMWFMRMERYCQMQLLAESAGTPKLIRPDVAQLTHDQMSGTRVAWHAFQPLYEEITADQPDLLD
jgi:ribulose-5-phosphate 4-epimerase/fuculose-1-phosphate aldolase